MHSFFAPLQAIARADHARRVFGAGSHRYNTTAISTESLVDFEKWCGCRLPEEYRAVITEIGIGAGPYYGLLSFERIREELTIIYEDHVEVYGNTAAPSDRCLLDVEVSEHRSHQKELTAPFDAPRSPGGFMPICHQGCEYMTVLVTSGEFAGLVFDATAFATVGAQWCPSRRPPGIVKYQNTPPRLPDFPVWPTFGEWYSGWLEQCRSDLQLEG